METPNNYIPSGVPFKITTAPEPLIFRDKNDKIRAVVHADGQTGFGINGNLFSWKFNSFELKPTQPLFAEILFKSGSNEDDPDEIEKGPVQIAIPVLQGMYIFEKEIQSVEIIPPLQEWVLKKPGKI